jgi:hypothetical protein
MDFLSTMVALTNSQMIKIAGDVICCASVEVPIRINLVVSSSRQSRGRGFFTVGFIHPMPTLDCSMPNFATDLAR